MTQKKLYYLARSILSTLLKDSMSTEQQVLIMILLMHLNGTRQWSFWINTLKLKQRLKTQGLLWHNLVADAGYSSGENYAFLENQGLQSYIPPHGTYKGGPEGFIYHQEDDYWLCPNQKKVTFRKITTEKNRNNNKKKLYLTKPSDCKGCQNKRQCIGKAPEKRITITIYKEEYERAIARVKSKRGCYMKSRRQSTVEPVFGTLTQFMGMRKINTIGIQQANKVMMMAAMAYNLKKYLKFWLVGR